ncbi:MAG: hypothetical protein FWC68_00410 [Oscillospiraceae bacterium]|nr:hypothetical protein [Oscillospiraceae bacterium]
MNTTLITVIAIFAVAVIILVYPLLAMTESNENITQQDVRVVTAEFVNEVTTRREITHINFERFLQRIHATGHTFDVEMEIVRIDENPGKKVVLTTSDMISENLTYSEFTTQIMDELFGVGGTGRVPLTTGDTVIVTVRNTDRTVGQIIRNFFTPGTGSNYRITASHAGMVTQ